MEVLVHGSYSDEKVEVAFLQRAKKNGVEYVIEVNDGEGSHEELWAVSEIEIIEAFKDFSKRRLYGQLHKIEDFIQFWYVPPALL